MLEARQQLGGSARGSEPQGNRPCACFLLRHGSRSLRRHLENLHHEGLVTDDSRVVLEKPIGIDLKTAEEINEGVGQYFKESNVFRIDHYLGKETVQNVIALRFANPLFESVWSADHIESVQITAGELVGVEGRAAYYDNSGALRDMVQNHLLQVLCLVAMEKPDSLQADDVRDAKVTVLKSLVPLDAKTLPTSTVRASTPRVTARGPRSMAISMSLAMRATPKPTLPCVLKSIRHAGRMCRSISARPSV